MRPQTYCRKVFCAEDENCIRNVFTYLRHDQCDSTASGRTTWEHDNIPHHSFDRVLFNLVCDPGPQTPWPSKVMQLQRTLIGRVLVVAGEVADLETLCRIERYSHLRPSPLGVIKGLYQRLCAFALN
jgi:hypothetical protein